MSRYFLAILFLLPLVTSNPWAQTPDRPFEYGTIPSQWNVEEDSEGNNGLLAVIFEGDFSRREVTSNGVYGSQCWKTVDQDEGGTVLVRQRLESLTFESFRSDFFNRFQEEGECNTNESESCTLNFLGEGRVNFNGFPGQKLSYRITRNYFKEQISCSVGMGVMHSVQDRSQPLTTYTDMDVYLVQVGKVQMEIVAGAGSSDPSILQARKDEINAFLATFRFFGRGAEGNDGNTPQDESGGIEGGIPQGGESDINTGGQGIEDDWTVGEVVVGVLAGAGAAAGVGLGIKAILNAGKNAAKPGSGSGNGPSSPNQNPRSPARKPKEDEEESTSDEEEDPGEEEDDQVAKKARYVLQLSQNKFNLKVGATADLQVAVWRMTQDGNRSIAQEAQIQLRSHSAALNVTPPLGQGSLSTRLEMVAQPESEKVLVDIMAQAGGSAIRGRIEVVFTKQLSAYEFISTQMPPDKMEIIPDGQDALFLYTQVRNTADPDDPEVPKLTSRIKLTNAGGDQGWMDLGEQKFIDGWQAIGFMARNPQPHLAGPGQVVKPPKQVSIEARVSLPDGNILSKIFDFPVRQPSLLDVDNDSVYFPAIPLESNPSSTKKSMPRQLDITAFIEDPVPHEKWTFTAAYEKDRPVLTALEIIHKSDGQAIIRLKNPSLPLKPGQGSEYSRLIIRAESAKRKAFNERQVHVTLRGEGIFLVKGQTNNVFQIWGDPEKEKTKAEFAVYVWDEKHQEMVSDRRAVEHLIFDQEGPNKNDKKALNMLSVAEIKPEYEFPTGDNHAVFSFQVKHEIPGEEKVLPYFLRVKTHSDIADKNYEIDIPAGIFAAGIGPNSADWLKEYNFCKTYIEKHVPDKYKADMLKMVEDRKMELGHEGLYYLRHRIHGITVNLILAEGAEGYRKADKWYTDVIEMLQWAEWAGNLAFNAVAASIFGPYAPAVTISKSYGIQALQYVLEGKTLEQWVYDSFTLHALFKAGEGRLIDVDKLHDYFKGDGGVKAYAEAWAIFIAYHFAYNVFWEKKSVVESLKQVAREIRDEAIVMFFQKKLQAEGEKGKDGMEIAPDPIKKLRRGMVAKADGNHVVRMEDMLECMRDPRAMRSLKKASPELQDAFNRTREAMYKEHDDGVRSAVSQKTGIPESDLRIDDFRTPGGAGSNINTDRDYRLLYRAGKDAQGNDIWFEVPKEKWQDISYKKFGELTGKPPGTSDLDWATKHLQLATDKAHIEASPDYSDHSIDPATGQKIIIRPNIIAVEEGTSRLFDSTALGNMYHEKVHASLRAGQLSEAIAQAKKSVDTLNKVRHGYRIQNLDVGQLHPSIQQGMGIVKMAPTDLTATPAAMAKFNQQLKDAGFRDLEDFSNKLASNFEALKVHDQQPGSVNTSN